MNITNPQAIALEKRKLLSVFKEDIRHWLETQNYGTYTNGLRVKIEQNVREVRKIVEETRCLRLIAATPNRISGGLIVRDCDPFNYVLETPYYGVSYIPEIIEIVDEAICVLNSPRYLASLVAKYEDR